MHNTYVLHYCFTFIIPATDVTSLQPAFRGCRRFPSPSLNRAFPKPSRLFPRERPVSAPPTPTPTPKNRFKSDRRAPKSLQSTQEAETVSIPKKNLWNRKRDLGGDSNQGPPKKFKVKNQCVQRLAAWLSGHSP